MAHTNTTGRTARGRHRATYPGHDTMKGDDERHVMSGKQLLISIIIALAVFTAIAAVLWSIWPQAIV